MAQINVTPLVDVILVLLITFMIAMPVLTYTISIDLPSTSLQDQSNSTEEPLRLSIDRHGDYFLNDTSISTEEFSTLAQEKSHNNQNVVLAISADETVDYKYVIEVLETAQKAGIKKIGFVTKQE
ncbi:MAG: biopolymer transporter ExbD [Neisseriaceae bacterium]|nr:MAG: biopolymer transporter ExbD [Neisseriaceae bacterium]